MARGLMAVVAFAATVAQAQEAPKAAEGTDRAALTERQQPAVLVASRLAPQPSAGNTDAAPGTAEGTWDKFAVCSLPVAFLGDEAPPVRTYSPPPAARTKSRPGDWGQAPYVKRASHCGNLYIFQIKSKSKEPWAIERARAEGADGKALQVNAFRSDKGSSWDINVIVAETPPGMKVPWLKLNLTGTDGRVAQLEVRDLP